jgi:hypothetical protein
MRFFAVGIVLQGGTLRRSLRSDKAKAKADFSAFGAERQIKAGKATTKAKANRPLRKG